MSQATRGTQIRRHAQELTHAPCEPRPGVASVHAEPCSALQLLCTLLGPGCEPGPSSIPCTEPPALLAPSFRRAETSPHSGLPSSALLLGAVNVWSELKSQDLRCQRKGGARRSRLPSCLQEQPQAGLVAETWPGSLCTSTALTHPGLTSTSDQVLTHLYL